MTSLVAMARLDSPLTTNDRISLSRCVRPCRAPGQNSSRCSRAAGVDRPRGHAGVDRCLAAVHELELTDQLVAADALQQIARRADAQRLEEVLLVVVDRQHHDLALRVLLAQLQAQVQSAGPLHADVAQHDVGIELVDHAERPLSADGLADHLHPVLERREHRLEALDDHLVVVDQHKPRNYGRRFLLFSLCVGVWGAMASPEAGTFAAGRRTGPARSSSNT